MCPRCELAFLHTLHVLEDLIHQQIGPYAPRVLYDVQTKVWCGTFQKELKLVLRTNVCILPLLEASSPHKLKTKKISFKRRKEVFGC